MKSLKGTKTHENLKAAFAGESQANRRYLYFANKADVEGQNDVAALFRSTAEGETGHAHGHLDYIAQVGDPATSLPIGSSRQNLKAAVAREPFPEGAGFADRLIGRHPVRVAPAHRLPPRAGVQCRSEAAGQSGRLAAATGGHARIAARRRGGCPRAAVLRGTSFEHPS